MLRLAIWSAIWTVGVASLLLGMGAVVAWWRSRRRPDLRLKDSQFHLGMSSFMSGLLFLAAAGVFVGVEAVQARHDEFMRECVLHRLRYECTALWRAGNRDDPAIIPLLIPIPTR
jgi:hypothetical protein